MVVSTAHRGSAYAAKQEAVRRVLAAIAYDYSWPWTVQELADEARFSKFYFTRFFTDIMGVTPLHYLTHYRTARAKELLTTTSETVTEITTMIGYVSIGCFSSGFSNRVGVTPTAWRRGVRPPEPAPVFSDDVMCGLGVLRYAARRYRDTT